ncbi:MAG TPA: STM4014 family protein [Xanthomonadales bacterium]|nr:STM4014 family protein [Xanthomonadales bacterium]
MTRGLLIGDPRARRTLGLRAAFERHGIAPFDVLEWHAALERPEAVADERRAWVKLDPPDDDPLAQRRLVELGARLLGVAARADTAPGELCDQHLWAAGLAAFLTALEAADTAQRVRWLNPPADIRTMLDKLECQRVLAAHGVATPALLGAVGSYAELVARADAAGCNRAFVKPRFGSSAAGVVAWQRASRGRELAIANCALAPNGRLINVLAPRRLHGSAAIAPLVDALAAQSLYAERWVPKPRVPAVRDTCFDARVVAFRGVARQRVARTARAPLTNLNLGNRRAALEACLDAERMQRLEVAVAHAARAFPASASIGFDVIPCGAADVFVEANAFGDLLPRLEWLGNGTWDDQALLLGAAERAAA